MSALTIISQVLAYDDVSATSNPQEKLEHKRVIQNLPVNDPSRERITLEPLASTTVFDGSRSTAIDGTTEFSLAFSSLDANRYRITRTAGTAPAFRTARALTLSGVELTLTLNSNQSVTVTPDAGTPFGAVQAGDVVFIPGTATGDSAGPFNPLNVGYWTVLSASAATITLARSSGDVFEGASEVVTPSDNSEVQAFSTTGVQVGDTVDISAGFATTTRRAYEVLGVNPSWVEIYSTLALGAETGIIPTATGMVFYTDAKCFLHVEADQECVIRLNGDTGSTQRLTPWIAGDPLKVGAYSKTGIAYRMVVVNLTSVPLKLLVISVER